MRLLDQGLEIWERAIWQSDGGDGNGDGDDDDDDGETVGPKA